VEDSNHGEGTLSAGQQFTREPDPVPRFSRSCLSAFRLGSAAAIVTGSISAQNHVPTPPPPPAQVKLELQLELPPDTHQEGLFSNTSKTRSQVGAVQFSLSEATLIAAIHCAGPSSVNRGAAFISVGFGF